ncbi:MAG: DUF2207 family protein [Actinomycetota bacterium]
MGKGGKLIALAVITVPVIAIAVVAVNAPRAQGGSKSYSFPRVAIDATINPDGSLDLVERRTFDFTGPFSFAFFTIESVHAPPARIKGFQISEGGRPVQHVDTVEGGNFTSTWFFDARDERRTFRISYRVECAVDVSVDAAHLLWQFVGTGWTEKTDVVRVAVHVPGRAAGPIRRPAICPAPARRLPATEPLAPGDVKAWGHGPLNGRVTIADAHTVVFTARDVAPGQFVEGSILMPPEVVPLAADNAGPRRAEVLAEEQRLADEANALRRRHARETLLVKALLGLIPLAMGLLVAIAYRRDRVPGVPPILQEPPEEAHPVEVALLWSTHRKQLAPKTAYRTQFLHLARAGVIELQPVGAPMRPMDFQIRLRRPADAGLDAEFVEFLFAGDGQGPVSLSEVKDRGTRREELADWWKKVGRKAKGQITAVTKGRSRLESTLVAMLAVGAGVYGYWRSLGFEEGDFAFRGLVGPLGLALIPVAALSWLVAARLMPPRLPGRLRERVARWKAFRRFLKRFSTLEDAPALAVIVWERHLVYATALGVADEVEKQVRALVPAGELSEPWPGAPPGDEGWGTYTSWRTSSPAYAPAAAATAVGWSGGWGSSSGGGGGGGGFSGGGGGGGGGTGGGAG